MLETGVVLFSMGYVILSILFSIGGSIGLIMLIGYLKSLLDRSRYWEFVFYVAFIGLMLLIVGELLITVSGGR